MDNKSFLYYFRDCPTCKNYDRNLVRECALHSRIALDERYILALPDVWGAEADVLSADGAEMPFLYCPETKQWLNIDYQMPEMRDEVMEFFGAGED